MATRRLLWKSERISYSIFRLCQRASVRQQVVTYSNLNAKKIDENLEEEPVPFSSSKAAEFNSLEYAEKQGRTNRPKHEPLIVKISLISFMVYFCILREESDWDLELDTSLFDRVPGLEITMLRNKMKNASQTGAEPFTEADRLRLKELEKSLESN